MLVQFLVCEWLNHWSNKWMYHYICRVAPTNKIQTNTFQNSNHKCELINKLVVNNIYYILWAKESNALIHHLLTNRHFHCTFMSTWLMFWYVIALFHLKHYILYFCCFSVFLFTIYFTLILCNELQNFTLSKWYDQLWTHIWVVSLTHWFQYGVWL